MKLFLLLLLLLPLLFFFFFVFLLIVTRLFSFSSIFVLWPTERASATLALSSTLTDGNLLLVYL